MKRKIKILLFLFVLLTQPGLARSGEGNPACPDEKSLTLKARTVLVQARKLMEEENPAGARQALEIFVQDYPDQNHTFIRYALANLCLEENRLEKALAFYEQTLEFCPDYSPAWQNMGKVCFDLEKFSRAARALEKAWDLTGQKNHILRFHAAVAHVSAHAPQKALAHTQFLTSGRAGPVELKWVRLLVQLSIDLKQSVQALERVEHLLTLPEPQPYLFRLAASLYLSLNQFEKAAETLSAYALLELLTPSEQTLLADLYNNLGIPARAARNYEKAIAMEPSRKKYERLASAWAEALEYDKAMEAVQKGLTAFPESHALWKLKGWITYENKNFKAAALAFSQAASLKKNDDKALFMSGLCACKAGEHKEARIALVKAARKKQYRKQAMELISQMDLESGRM